MFRLKYEIFLILPNFLRSLVLHRSTTPEATHMLNLLHWISSLVLLVSNSTCI